MKRIQRVIVAVLVVALVAGQMGTLNVSASSSMEMQEGKTENVISAFSELPEEVRKQTVPVGTELDALVLPDSLEAVILTETKGTESPIPTESPAATSSPIITPNPIATASPIAIASPTATTDPAAGEETEDGASETPAASPSATENPEEPDASEDMEGTEGSDTSQDAEKTEAPDIVDSGEETKNSENTGEPESPEGTESKEQTETAIQTETGEVFMEEYNAPPQSLTIDTLAETEREMQEITIEGIDWESTPEYNGETEGIYTFTPILPEGYRLSEDANLPQILVTVVEDSEGELLALITLLEELPDPHAYLASGEADKEMINEEQLHEAREVADGYLEQMDEMPAVLEPLLARLEGLEHIRDTEKDCLDLDCPYHYPEIIKERSAVNEIPELLTLENLVEDYGVEPPAAEMDAGSNGNSPLLRSAPYSLRAASAAKAATHPKTLMVTTDNENNAHTGASDGDIDVTMSRSKGTHPIELSFTLNELPTQSAYLAVKAYDVDEDSGETDYVYLNDDIYQTKDTIGYLSGTNNTWNTSVLEIPLEKLQKGKNVISITVASGWVVNVDWMQLILDGGGVDPNIEEFSLKLEDTSIENNNVAVQSLVTIKQKGNTQYATEYTLTQVETGNALDACFGQATTSEDIELTMPLSSPSGVYKITGILKNPSTEEIKATDSILFYFVKGVGVGPKISHTLTPDILTKQNVTINVSAEAVPDVGITDVTVSSATRTVSANGTYSFAVNYHMNGTAKSFSYSVKVDNIDKVAPVLTYTPFTIIEEETQETVEKLFADALSVSDDRKLADKPLSYTIPANVSNLPGTKTITVKAADSVGNTSTKSCQITVKAKPIKLTLGTLTAVSGSKDKFTLKAVLNNTGADTITETGFVWGVTSNPTLEVKNGSVKTSSVIKTKGGTLSATATGLVSGVAYYARAYAKVTAANGSTSVVYSDARPFGFGIPSYGTFSVSGVSNSGSTTSFTITRSGGTDKQQTVSYRTVNGSAIGGTHFTHKQGTVTFADGETTKTVTVAELGVTSAYKGDTGTCYSNADRTYSLEIYRVEGGGTIDQNNRSKTRTMAKNSSYTIARSIYTTEKSITQIAATGNKDGKKIADTTGKQGGKRDNVSFLTNRDKNQNYHTSSSFSSYYTDTYQRNYLNATASGWYYRYVLRAYEDVDGYEHAYFGTSALEDRHYGLSGDAAAVSGVSGQLWACNFLQGCHDAIGTYNFPDTRTGGGENSHYPKNSSGTCTSYNGKTYVNLNLSNTCYIYFGCTGKDSDIWYLDGLTSYVLVHDTNEPVLLGVAPMASGTYLPGDPITVSLVFDEIVDSANSSLSGLTITTNVGTLTYAGGADTNVLYFRGTVSSAASLSGSTALKVTGISNTSGIKDMCSLSGTSATFTSSNTNVAVDATKPTVTITPVTTGSLPRHKATVSATGAASIQYVWAKDTALPAYGWSNVTSGTTLTESRDSGTTGAAVTWYLHVLATASSGATTHVYQAFTFMQPAITEASVREGTSTTSAGVADVWKPKKYIHVKWAGAQTSGTTLTWSKAGTTVKNITSKTGSTYLTVTENGPVTVTIKDSYGNVVSKIIDVTKIDGAKPTVTIQSGSSTGADKVYNSLTMALFPKDTGGSGVAKVEYAWTNTTTAPAAAGWTTLAAAEDGSYQAKYTAAETAKTAIYLQVRVTDGAGNVSSVVRQGPYQVMKPATGAALPTIRVTGNPTSWVKGASLAWTAAKGTGTGAGAIKNVYTPDGAQTGDFTSGVTAGTSKVAKNGFYIFMVTDEYGNSVTREVLVTKIDNEAPKVESLTATGGQKGMITLNGATDACTVVYDRKGNFSSFSGSGIKTSQYQMEGENTWTAFTGNSFTVTKNGNYTIKLTDALGNSSEQSVEMTDIDGTAPEVTYKINATPNAATGWYTSSVPVILNFEDKVGEEGGTPSGIQSVQYKWVENNTAAPSSGLSGLAASAIANGTYTCPSSSLYGTYYLYYKVTDKKGNVTEGFSEKIQRDYSCSFTVTGPKEGQPLSSGLDMKVNLRYGHAGGYLTGTTQGERLSTMEAYGGACSSSQLKTVEAVYTVKSAGTQRFRYYRNSLNGTTYNYSTFYVRQITFNSQGGSAVESQLVWDKNSTAAYCYVQEPEIPVRTGYTFGGWYTDAACTNGNEFVFSTAQVRANTTLYAKWTANTYSVTYRLTNPDGSAYAPDSAYQAYTYGQGLSLPAPEKEGYAFYGWYTDGAYSGTAYTEIGKTATGNKTYYGYFKDIQAPELTVSRENFESEVNEWQRAQGAYLKLTYSDNAGVTEIWSKVDEGDFTQISDISTGKETAYTKQYDLQEGTHTYIFKAIDGAGNETVSEPVTVKWDKTNPVTGEITCEQKAANVLDWIMGRESLIIHIPVKDDVSGVKTLTYTETTFSPDGETTEEKTVELSGKAGEQTVDLKFDADWKGKISNITCTDTAGNASDTKSIENAANGIIVENNPPEITIAEADMSDESNPKQGNELSTDYYEEASAPTLYVSVVDEDTDSGGITAGIAGITYAINGTEKTVEKDFTSQLTGSHSFTIALDGIAGVVSVTVKAFDYAGNTAEVSAIVKIRGQEATPEAVPDYQKDALTDLVPEAEYAITVDGNTYNCTADHDGQIPFIISADGNEIDLCGQTIDIVRKGDGINTIDSEAQNVSIQARPDALDPDQDIEVTPELAQDAGDAEIKITIDVGSGDGKDREYSTDGGNTWIPVPDDNIIKDLGPGDVIIRDTADEDTPHGEEVTVTIPDNAGTITTVFDLNYADAAESKSQKDLKYTSPLTKPADPVRAGYDFVGWYKDASCQGESWNFNENVIGDVFNKDKTNYENGENNTIIVRLYAKWRENVAPDIDAVLTDGTTTDPKDAALWYSSLSFAVSYSDNEGVTGLYVSRDGGEAVALPISESSENGTDSEGNPQYRIAYKVVEEGEHTYTFKGVDAAGNEKATGSLTAKLDVTKPVSGEASFNTGYKNLWDWIIRKDSLEITIPITEAGSGIAAVDYKLTPADGQSGSAGESTGQATVKKISGSGSANYTATISIAPDFKGSIVITAKDNAGNISDTKTIGTDGSGINGVIVEDNAPAITILADRDVDGNMHAQGTSLSEDYYNTAPRLNVIVKDDASGAVTGGLAAVLWKVDTDEEQTASEDFQTAIKTSYNFTIIDLEGKTGTYDVFVKAVDQAGNIASETVTVHIKSREAAPNPSIDYQNEKLTGLDANGSYVIEAENITADAKGCIAIKEEWFGSTIQIYKKGVEGLTLESESVERSIAARPAAPSITGSNETIKGKKDGTLTGTAETMEYSVDGGQKWTSINESKMENLAPGEIWIRVRSARSAPHGERTVLTIEEGRTLTVTFVENGGSSTEPVKGKSWQDTVDKPENPVRTRYAFEGWYQDNSYKTIWHFTSENEADKLTKDVTLYAKWRDNARPDLRAVLEGNKDENQWYQALSVVLNYSDNEGVTELSVKKDAGEYRKLDMSSSTLNGSISQYQLIFDELDEGEHTYTFKAVDAAGNETVTNGLTAKFDTIKPLLGEVSFKEGYSNLWNWIISKERLEITIPITEKGSGIDTVDYELTPADGQTGSTGKATVKKSSGGSDADYTAAISIDPDFKGSITITAADKAGNISDKKIIGADGTGVIVEDNPPAITILADRYQGDNESTQSNGVELSTNYYETVPDLVVKVEDDVVNNSQVTSSGLSSVSWQIDNEAEMVIEDFDSSMQSVYRFDINALAGRSGVHTVTVKAVDQAGNVAEQRVTVKIKGTEVTPNPIISYMEEKLTGLKPNADYYINNVGVTADENGEIKIEEYWFGTSISIYKPGDNIATRASESAQIAIPERMEAPNAQINYREEKLTGLEADVVYLIDGKSIRTDERGLLAVKEGWMDDQEHSIVREAMEDQSQFRSSPQKLVIPIRPEAPSGVTGTAVSKNGASDGRLSGMDESMEYRGENSSLWVEVMSVPTEPDEEEEEDGEDDSDSEEYTGIMIEGLSAGYYLVRLHATDSSFAGKAIKINLGLKMQEQDKETENETGSGDGNHTGDNSEGLQKPVAAPTSVPTAEPQPQKEEPQQAKEAQKETEASEDIEKPEAADETAASYTVLNGRIVPKAEKQTLKQGVGKENEKAVLIVDQGRILVTLNNVDESLCTAKVPDVAAVANAVLSEQEITRISGGEEIEIRIDVERIDNQVSMEDKQLAEQGIETKSSEMPELTIGMYIDISMYMRLREGEWNAVRETNEPVEISIDLPEELKGISAEFYVVRVHEGEYTLLQDLDDDAETITIQTSLFSTYAIAYSLNGELEEGAKCGLCHICPTFLGICCFIWLAVILGAVIVVMVLLRRKKQKEQGGENGEC